MAKNCQEGRSKMAKNCQKGTSPMANFLGGKRYGF